MDKNHPWFKSYPTNIEKYIQPSQDTINDLLEKAISKYEDKVAFYNMRAQITFKEFDTYSIALANYLIEECGLKKGDRVAVQMPNLLQTPISVWGILKAGLIVVNLNPLYTPKEMQHQLKDSGAKAIIILENYLANLESIIDKTELQYVIATTVGEFLPGFRRYLAEFFVRTIQKMVPPYNLTPMWLKNAIYIGEKHQYEKPNITREDIAFLQYTGGTTGVAKGAMLTHGNIVSNINQIVEYFINVIHEGMEWVCTPLPLYHIFAMTCNFLTFTSLGSSNVLITNPKNVKAFVHELRRYPFTVITGVNTLYNALLNTKKFHKINWSTYKFIVAGGTALQRSVADKFTEKTGKKIIEGYGLTETSPIIVCNPSNKIKVGSVGLPVPSTEIAVLNDEGIPQPLGQSGEIGVKGPQVMKGYWNRQEETDKVFKNGWFLTGDIGIFSEDGFLSIVDRKKDMIIVSGFNVYPNEIEDVIARHPAVKEVVVIGTKDEKTGERPIAFVVKRENHEIGVEDLRWHCKKHLTNYKIPREFIFKNELPKSNVGKILRRIVKEEYNKKGA